MWIFRGELLVSGRVISCYLYEISSLLEGCTARAITLYNERPAVLDELLTIMATTNRLHLSLWIQIMLSMGPTNTPHKSPKRKLWILKSSRSQGSSRQKQSMEEIPESSSSTCLAKLKGKVVTLPPAAPTAIWFGIGLS